MNERNRGVDVQSIEGALVQAHRSAARVEPGPFFQKRAMARILEEDESERAPVSNGLSTGRVVWRFALVSYLVVIVLAAHLMTSDVDSQYQLSRFILDESSSLDLLNTFGIL
jgi:hypothetical protein